MRLFFTGIIFCFLALIALVPLIISILSSYEGGFLISLQSFFEDHSGITISLATLLLVSGLALLAAHIANRSAERRERQNRKLAQELKLVEFRQAWIDQLRQAFADYHGILYSKIGETLDEAGLAEVVSRIILLMNPSDPDFAELVAIQKAMLVETEGGKRTPSLIRSNELGQRILKREWDRLKADLNNVENL